MKQLSLTAAALALVVAPVGLAAQTASADVTASARVEASLTANTTNQLQFGTLAMGSSSTLASSGGSQAALSSAGGVGLGQVRVEHNSNVNVATTVPAVLTHSTSGQTLGFSATCAVTGTSGGSAASDQPSCSSFSFTAGAPGTVQETYVLVGGTVTGNVAAGVGDFTGTISFTFTAAN